MAGKCTAARVAAVVAMILCGSSISAAELHFNTNYNANAPEHERVKAVPEFLRYNYRKFMATGSIHDRKRKGRPQKVPKDVLKECAKYLQQGFAWVPLGSLLPIHRHFTSMEQAVAAVPYLAAICAAYNVNPQQLLRKIKRVDPELVHKRLHFKKPLSIPQQQERQAVACQLYTVWLADPTVFNRACYVDEAAFTFSVDCMSKNLKVWCHRGSAGVNGTMFSHQMLPGTKYRTITVRLIAMINPLLGPVAGDFTTGTTDLQRRCLPPMMFLVSVFSIALQSAAHQHATILAATHC